MKKLAIAVITVLAVVGCKGGIKAGSNDVLVAYFSATGTTAAAAQKLADAIGADIFEIKPVTAYTDADLDWRDSTSRSTLEMKDKTSRPEIAALPENLDQYSTVFIGFPNWWGTAPTIINTFVESVDLAGKTVALFETSGSTGIEKADDQFRRQYPEINWKAGMRLNDVDEAGMKAFAESVAAK